MARSRMPGGWHTARDHAICGRTFYACQEGEGWREGKRKDGERLPTVPYPCTPPADLITKRLLCRRDRFIVLLNCPHHLRGGLLLILRPRHEIDLRGGPFILGQLRFY